jgi:AcrR family transcriptional regulator
MHEVNRWVKKDFAPLGSLNDILVMGRAKNFTREAVLAKAMPIFWQRGFADTSLHELEQATGVNKSGLYAEFKDKEDLFLQSLGYYLEGLEKKGLLTAEPLGWNNIERFLKIGPSGLVGQKGCFAVNCLRESAILPREAIDLVTRSRSNLKQLLAKNIEAERTKMNPQSLAQLVLTFFTGLSMEQNLSLSRRAVDRNIDDLISILRTL